MHKNGAALTGGPVPHCPEVMPVQSKHPLICAGCGQVIGWARRAIGHEVKCTRCKRVTVFTIRAGRVDKVLVPGPKPPRPRRRRRARSGPPGRRELESMMRQTGYVDYWKC
jgi:phage FluMu protein Com